MMNIDNLDIMDYKDIQWEFFMDDGFVTKDKYVYLYIAVDKNNLNLKDKLSLYEYRKVKSNYNFNLTSAEYLIPYIWETFDINSYTDLSDIEVYKIRVDKEDVDNYFITEVDDYIVETGTKYKISKKYNLLDVLSIYKLTFILDLYNNKGLDEVQSYALLEFINYIKDEKYFNLGKLGYKILASKLLTKLSNNTILK